MSKEALLCLGTLIDYLKVCQCVFYAFVLLSARAVCMYLCMLQFLRASMSVCIYVPMHLCIYVSMYLCIYVSMCLCVYIRMYVHV